jgi:hypothetical protein
MKKQQQQNENEKIKKKPSDLGELCRCREGTKGGKRMEGCSSNLLFLMKKKKA